MSTKRSLWLNYNNDQKKYQIPVNPEKISITVDGKMTTSDIDSFGDVLHKGKRGPMKISWSSFFPAQYGSYCAPTKSGFHAPQTMHNWVIALMNAAQPVHFVMTGGTFPINIYAIIKSYKPYEEGGDPGSIYYSIELYEYRGITITSYTKPKPATPAPAKKTVTQKRVTNVTPPRTYTIKRGDCLWNIAKKYYGSGAKYTKILNANRSTLDSAARKYGYSNCRNGNLIFAGVKITIPY